MRFEYALEEAARFGVADRLDQLRQHIPTSWIEAALQWTGTASIRRRRLPADQVVWLVICMALFRNESIERIVDMLGLALPDQDDTKVAKSAVTQARQRLGEEPLAQLFAMTAKTWALRSADANRWRGLALYGWDGTTMYVPDSPENRAEFGGQNAGGGRGDSGYPQVRVVATMALRSHIISAFRFAPYSHGEVTVARDLWLEMPENSLAIVDRNFLVKKDLIALERSGNRHWLSRTKSNTRWAVVETLGKHDFLVELEVQGTNLPKTWPIRAIRYMRRGHAVSTLLTSLVDAERYPAEEIIALYHERWELELGYDEIKTHLLERQEALRSRSHEGVRQELWGVALVGTYELGTKLATTGSAGCYDVPIAVNSGEPDPAAGGDAGTANVGGSLGGLGGLLGGGGGNVICALFGHTTPFTPEQLAMLYPTHQDYVDKVTASAASTRAAGFILPEEEMTMVSDAASAPVPK